MVNKKFKMREDYNKLSILVGDCNFYDLFEYLSSKSTMFFDDSFEYFSKKTTLYLGKSRKNDKIKFTSYHTSCKLEVIFPRDCISSEENNLLPIVMDFKILTEDEVLYEYESYGEKYSKVPEVDITDLKKEFLIRLQKTFTDLDSLLDNTPLNEKYGLNCQNWKYANKSLKTIFLEWIDALISSLNPTEILVENRVLDEYKAELIKRADYQSDRIQYDLDASSFYNNQ